jgi:hypothetical protein
MVVLTMASSDESTIADEIAIMPSIPAIVGPVFSGGSPCMGLPRCGNFGTRRRFSKLVVSGEYWKRLSPLASVGSLEKII